MIDIDIDLEKFEMQLLNEVNKIETLTNEALNESTKTHTNLLKNEVKENTPQPGNSDGYATGLTAKQVSKRLNLRFGSVIGRVGFYGDRAHIARFNELGTSKMKGKHFMEKSLRNIAPIYQRDLAQRIKNKF